MEQLTLYYEQVQKLTKTLQGQFTLVTNFSQFTGSEVTYSLSNDYSYCFEDMLANLEKNREEIGFTNYGLTTTTIEDVFMS